MPQRAWKLLRGAGGVLAATSLLVVLPGALLDRGSQASVTGAKAHAVSAATLAAAGGPLPRWVARPIQAGLTSSCQPASTPTGYVNPLARARVKPERIDQGVDYAGSGTLTAMGAARITNVETSGAGWPGSFIEYRLLNGSDSGCYVYYAEGVNPVPGLRVGETVAAGQPVASLISGWETGIEVGWGAGVSTVTYAAKTHEWNDTSDENSKASAAGKSFSALIAALGGKPGKVEG